MNYSLAEFPIKSKEVLYKTIYSRIVFLRQTIDEIDLLIDERQRLRESISSEIEQKVCDVQNVIHGLELDMCGVIDKSRRRISLEQQIGELYREERQQKMSHWQDTVKLKHERRMAEKELRSAMLDLWMIRFLS